MFEYTLSFVSFLFVWSSWYFDLWYLTPAYMLGIIPLMDMILPKQDRLKPEKLQEIANDKRYEQILLVWSVCYILFEFWLYTVSSSFSLWQVVFMSFSNGILSVQSFAAAHELLHKRDKLMMIISNLMLTFNAYLHFYKSHKHVHHAFIGTEKDPSSAPKGMTIYEFIPRSVIGNLKWLLLEQPIFLCWCFVIYYFIISALISYSTYTFLFWALQTTFAIIMLETVNYIEHYGVKRVGKQSPSDSWDTNYSYMNWITFRLGFHSHHHVRVNDSYQVLDYNESSLKMPYDYPIMMMLALIPSYYFSLTHPILEKN